MAVRAIRGAVQVATDDSVTMFDAVSRLVREVLGRNGLAVDDLICVIFTATRDLRADFPAHAARRAGITQVPLLCAVEIDVPGALPRVVRMMALTDTDRARGEIRHVYLGAAAALRTDLVQ